MDIMGGINVGTAEGKKVHFWAMFHCFVLSAMALKSVSAPIQTTSSQF